VNDLAKKWHTVGSLEDVALQSVPPNEGIFAISEPKRYLFLTRHDNMRQAVEFFLDRAVLTAVGNRFWTPSPQTMSLQLVERAEVKTPLRLLELKALEVYRPILNLLPAA
jgi:hypothetical protein